ncbi:MAG: putative manganese transporter [Clostridioides sp.]|jgi:hypothetical protein|nr:putative manganese transporter [Clostridioides sp.]
MEFIISASEESFLHIGTMIGFFILLFEYVNHASSGKFAQILSEHRRLQPLFGAVVGAIPGCGGTIAIVPLYVSGDLSFGTIIASLIASLGDASFVLMSSNLKLFFFVMAILFVTGVVTGYLVDILKLSEKLGIGKQKISIEEYYRKNNVHIHKDNHEGHQHGAHKDGEQSLDIHKHVKQGKKCCTDGYSKNNCDKKDKKCKLVTEYCSISNIEELAHEHGNSSTLAYILTHGIGYKVYIGTIIIGFLFMLIAHSGIESPFISSLHSLEEIISVIGIVFSIIYMIAFRKVFKDENVHEHENKKHSFRELLIHSVGDISFVITWIFIAYIAYDVIIFVLGGDKQLVNLVLSTGIISVFIGAGLGLIPGCGIQILLMSLYLKGSVPLAALIANAISQDGDALFPILAMDKKAALWSMVITTIPAVIIGVIVFRICG